MTIDMSVGRVKRLVGVAMSIDDRDGKWRIWMNWKGLLSLRKRAS